MTELEPDIRDHPASLCLIEDLYVDLEVVVETLARLEYLGWTLHEEGTSTADEIDARLTTELQPVIEQLVAAVRNAGLSGVSL